MKKRNMKLQSVTSIALVLTLIVGGSLQLVSADENHSAIESNGYGIYDCNETQYAIEDGQNSFFETLSEQEEPSLYDTSLAEISSDELAESDAIIVSDKAVENVSEDDYYNILNTDTDIIIKGLESGEVLSNEGIIVEDSENTIGYYLSLEDNGIEATPIVALPIDDNYCLCEDEVDTIAEELMDDQTFPTQDIVDDAAFLKERKAVAKVSGIGKAFASNSKFVYLYKKGNVSGTGTTYDYSAASTKSGWSKIGSISLNIYAVSAKTLGTTTFDKVYGECYASGLNGTSVTEYKPSFSVTQSGTNSIPSYSIPENGSSTSRTSSMNTGISSTGGVSSSSTESIEYNPFAMDVQTLGGEKYFKRWVCKPTSAISNKSYELAPSILVKKTDGTTKSNKISFYVNHFYLKKGARTYKIKVIDDATCSINIKNHKVG